MKSPDWISFTVNSVLLVLVKLSQQVPPVLCDLFKQWPFQKCYNFEIIFSTVSVPVHCCSN